MLFCSFLSNQSILILLLFFFFLLFLDTINVTLSACFLLMRYSKLFLKLVGNAVVMTTVSVPSSTSCCQGEFGRPGQKVRVSINHFIFSAKWIYSNMRYSASASLGGCNSYCCRDLLVYIMKLWASTTLTGCTGHRDAEMGCSDATVSHSTSPLTEGSNMVTPLTPERHPASCLPVRWPSHSH